MLGRYQITDRVHAASMQDARHIIFDLFRSRDTCRECLTFEEKCESVNSRHAEQRHVTKPHLEAI